MSDTSDDDLVPHNFQPENTGFYTQLSKPNYGSYNNMMNSNFNMPNRFMAFDQRSMYSRRETSPMSLRSFPNSRMQYQQSNPQSAMSFRGSVNNARCRSPMSVRSICSNTTVSAVDIALALKNYKFNKNDERMINEAYNTFKKSQMRKRIAKRRNLKFLKFCRRNLDGESGAEGSNSSLSSDDCRSTRSAVYTRNMPKAVARPPRMDLNKFTTQVRENNNYTDCTENFRQNSFRNLLTTHSRNVNHSFMPHDKQQNVTYDNRYPKVSETRKDQCSESQSASVVTLKDRLAKDTSLLLPIQRFNMSNVNPTYEISYKVKSKTAPQKESASNNRIEESDIESEEILPPSTSRGNLTHSNTLQKKRALETENISYPESKRKKLTTSPVKQNKIASSERMKRITTNTKKDFNFKKPLLPVRKFGTLMRDNEPEILIAKSTQPLVGNVEPLSNLLKETPQIVISEEKSDTNKHTKQPSQNHVDTTNNNTVADTMYNSTNVSIKPSFTKRKLFTQTLDIVENNVSNDNSGVDSPQTKTLRTCREKNKVRKLTSQSCLSRDVSDNNFMDLLHKFLPPDQKKNQTQNNTNVTNKKEASKCTQMKDKKWDVNLAISLTDMDDISETFTDEEIFNALEKDKGKTKQVNKDSNKGPDLADVPKKNQKAPASVCKATLQKTKETPSVIGDYTELSEKQYPKRRTVKSFVKSFWDTDFESDMEDIVTQTSQKNLEKDPIPSGSQFLMNGTNKIGAKKKPMDTTLPVRNPSKLGITQSIQSDDTQKLKSKMLDTNQQENKENINENKLNKSTRSRSKSNKANIQTEKTTNNKSDTNKVSNKANNQKNQQKPKPRTASSKRNNTPSQSIFNISRQSLRQGQASSNNSTSTNGINSPEVESHKCNTSRASMRLKQKREASLSNSSANDTKSPEDQSHKNNSSRASIRLKQKREASLSNSSANNTNSPEDQSHKNNTSRASMRLKQKRIAKLNNSFTNHTMSSENESDKCNTCKLNGNKRRVNLK